MSLKDKLLADLKLAMKNKEKIKKDTIQMVRAAVLQVEKDKKVVLSDEDILGVIAKELKKRKSALPDYKKSNRQDLIDNLNIEIEILSKYLPEQISEEELEHIVKEVIEEINATSMKDMGKVMAAIMPKTKGCADGNLVSTIVKKFLT